jgi:ribonuclease P protein component
VARHSESAVNRNRLKRRLRELVRTRLLPIAPPMDVVIRTRPDTYDAAFDALEADLAGIVTRLAQLS